MRKTQTALYKVCRDSYEHNALQLSKRSAFICIIAHSPADLIREREMLHHCIERMNYGQHFVREKSLILFIRNKQKTYAPFVTIAHSLKNRKILRLRKSRPQTDRTRATLRQQTDKTNCHIEGMKNDKLFQNYSVSPD